MTQYSLTDALGISAGSGEAGVVYDPATRESYDRLFSVFITLSLSAHFLLIAALWILPAPEEEQEITIVEMLEAPKVEEAPAAAAAPQKLQRKLLATRSLDASTTKFSNTAQPAIKQLAEVPVVGREAPPSPDDVALPTTERVQVGPVVTPGAPREITQKAFESKTAEEFAVNVKPAQQLNVPAQSPRAVMVNSARQSAGPRLQEASGPIVSDSPTIAAPNVAIGVLADAAVSGDPDGAAVFGMDSGNDSGARGGVDGGVAGGVAGGVVGGKVGGVPGGLLGGRGTGSGGQPLKDCMKEKACLEYLEMIRRRVYARWNNAGKDGTGGKVELRFRIDRGGSAHGAKVVRSDDKLMGETCVIAFNQANPFPPPPESIQYIVNKTITATFSVGE
jgi:TonB family protein